MPRPHRPRRAPNPSTFIPPSLLLFFLRNETPNRPFSPFTHSLPPVPPLPPTDARHLKALATAHVFAGVAGLILGLLPLALVAIGGAAIGGHLTPPDGESAPPAYFGWLFFGVGLFTFLGAQALAVLTLLTSRLLQRRERHKFCFLVACLLCTCLPFGTILGILSLKVLRRPVVRAAFSETTPDVANAT